MEAFYRGKTIFMTGATGFLGKVILEKLLWDLSSIRVCYILVRKKKDVAAQDRLTKELLPSRLWDRLRARHGDKFEEFVHSKVRCVHGDIGSERLDMSKQDYDMLANETNIIIHGAATITFNDPLKDAIQINTLGTTRMFDLAKKCKNLNVFHHISTCYVGCRLPAGSVVEEKILPLGTDPDALLKKMLLMPPEELEKRTPELIGSYPNTYTFTKALGEELISKHRGTIPLVILRPSIIGAAWKEPIGGWIDTVSAAGVIYMATGVGLLKMLQGDIRGIGDQVPVDMVTNAILASCMTTANQNKLEIYQVGTSSTNPLRWTTVAHTMMQYWDAHPPSKRIGIPEMMFIRNPYLFAVLYYVRFKMPVSVFKGLSALMPANKTLKQNAMLLQKLETRHSKITDTFTYFTTNCWIYEVTNTERLLRLLSDKDREKFNFDFTSIEWPLYLEQFGWGMLTFVLKDNIPHPLMDREVRVPNVKKGFFPDIQWTLRYGPRHQPTIDETMRTNVIKSPRVQTVLKQLMQTRKNATMSLLEKEANTIFDQMSGNVSLTVVRCLGWFFRKIYRHMYESILIDFVGLKKVYETSPNIPIVIIPTHKSYIDFLVISYVSSLVCFAYRLPLPHIAAGDDFLNIMIVNWIFRHCGAFFMRRSFDGDALYRAIFTEYVTRLVVGGYPLEFFIEGARSRTGKAMSPKMGMLSIIGDSYLDGLTPDVCLVPMPISYDKVVEDEQHVRELLGEPKPKLSLRGLITSGVNRVRSRNFGRIHIQFGAPISLREYTTSFLKERRVTSPAFNPYKMKEDRKVLIEELAYYIMDELKKNEMIMSTNVVSAIVLSEKRVVSKELLVARYIWLRNEIALRGGRVDAIAGDAPAAVDHACRLLNDCLDIRRNIVEPNIMQRKDYKHIAQLGYYSNQLVPVFFLEGILAVSLASFGEQFRTTGVALQDLLPAATFLKRLLQDEANDHLPNDDLRLIAAIDQMVTRGVLARDAENRLKLRESGERIFMFVCSLYWPFVDSYWVTCFTLLSVSTNANADQGIREEQFIERVQWVAEKFYFDGLLGHFQSCSRPAFHSSIHRFSQMRVCTRQNKVIKISPEYSQKESSKLMELCLKIGQYKSVKEDIKRDIYRTLYEDFPILTSRI